MNKEKIDSAAKILFNARLKTSSLEILPVDCIPKNDKEAYLIQDSLTNLYINQFNAKIIGKKVGCTNKKAQQQIKVNKPFYGNIYSSFSSNSKCNLDRKQFIKPHIEPEFSFQLNSKIDSIKGPITLNQTYDLIEKVIPSIEIVDSRFNDWTSIGINNLIADNGANAYWIKSKKDYNLNNVNFNNHIVKVFINENLIEVGNSNNVLNNPLNSLRWLLNTLSKQRKYLQKGTYVSTGTCTSAIPVSKKDIVIADFDSLGIVELQLK